MLLTTLNTQNVGFADYSVGQVVRSKYNISYGFDPVEPVTDDGQILIGYKNGTYTWATQTIQEL